MGTKIKIFFFFLYFFTFKFKKGRQLKIKNKHLLSQKKDKHKAKIPRGALDPITTSHNRQCLFAMCDYPKKNLILVLLLFGASPGVNFKIPKTSSKNILSNLHFTLSYKPG